MRPYQEEIVGNTVAYIAKAYYDRTHEYPAQMLVYKLLALLDFNSVVTKGRPCTELTYKARKMGPVPEELYKQSEDKYKNYFTFKTYALPNNRFYKRYQAVCKPNMDYLCPSEIKFLDEKINYFIENKFKSKDVSEYSHTQIKAWKKVADKNLNSVIDYALEFDGDIYSKPANELSMAEEYFLLNYGHNKTQNR